MRTSGFHHRPGGREQPVMCSRPLSKCRLPQGTATTYASDAIVDSVGRSSVIAETKVYMMKNSCRWRWSMVVKAVVKLLGVGKRSKSINWIMDSLIVFQVQATIAEGEKVELMRKSEDQALLTGDKF